jgi:ABC-2 type transport system permease protein
MNTFLSMLWIEFRKALRSKVPPFTAIGSLLMPLGIAFLLFISLNPEISRKLGLISAKATLMADTARNWPTYLATFAQVLAVGGLFLTVLALAWVFGREFTDGTLKDLLAVPVPRLNIILAKYMVAAAWSVALAILIFGSGLIVGALFKLPGGSPEILLQSLTRVAITTCLAIAAGLPFAFFASLGRGYLLPIGVLILTFIMANLMTAAGWGEYFPWAILGIYAQGKDLLQPVSFLIVVLTGLVGIVGTYLWWKYADQNR